MQTNNRTGSSREGSKLVETTCKKCGKKYQTKVVVIGTREWKQYPLCPVCISSTVVEKISDVAQGDIDAGWRTICPAYYQQVDVTIIPAPAAVIDKVKNWQPNDGRGMLLVGNTRTGKTMTTWYGLREIMRAGAKVEAVNDATIGIRYGDSLGRGQGWDYVERLVYPQVLFWDDFGKAKITERYAELAYAVIETRMGSHRPMIITTQLGIDDIVARFGDMNGSAIAERLRECCDVVML